MRLDEILADTHSLEEDMLAFERKYGVRSETSYAAYVEGEEPEDDTRTLDFAEWAGVYKTWLARQAEYRNEVRQVQRNATSLEGLVRVARCATHCTHRRTMSFSSLRMAYPPEVHQKSQHEACMNNT